MPRESLKILAINPGTKYLGFAVYSGDCLLDWGVRVIKGRWSKEKLKKAREILLSLMDTYQPKVLAIKRLHPARSSINLHLLALRIREFARTKGVKVYQYSIEELENFFLDERANKKELAEVMTSRYPELIPELKKEKSHKNPYHLRMFEAVALGSVCSHKLDK